MRTWDRSWMKKKSSRTFQLSKVGYKRSHLAPYPFKPADRRKRSPDPVEHNGEFVDKFLTFCCEIGITYSVSSVTWNREIYCECTLVKNKCFSIIYFILKLNAIKSKNKIVKKKVWKLKKNCLDGNEWSSNSAQFGLCQNYDW